MSVNNGLDDQDAISDEVSQVNAALERAGRAERVVYRKDADHFMLQGGDTDQWPEARLYAGMFDVVSTEEILTQINDLRKRKSGTYIKVSRSTDVRVVRVGDKEMGDRGDTRTEHTIHGFQIINDGSYWDLIVDYPIRKDEPYYLLYAVLACPIIPTLGWELWDKPDLGLSSKAAPEAIQQGTICSGWREGQPLCRHGHPQSSACNPVKKADGSWSPSRAPWCCREDVPTHFLKLNTGENHG
jgi:hypothetical protein